MGWFFKKDKKDWVKTQEVETQEDELLKKIIIKLEQKELKEWQERQTGFGPQDDSREFITNIQDFTVIVECTHKPCGDGCITNYRLSIYGSKDGEEHIPRQSGRNEPPNYLDLLSLSVFYDVKGERVEKLFRNVSERFEEFKRKEVMMERQKQEAEKERTRRISLARLKQLLEE